MNPEYNNTTIFNDIKASGFSNSVASRATELYLNVSNDCLKCGDSDVIEGFWIETHTLGCRNAADTPKDMWLDEHFEILKEYENDNVSKIFGEPDTGIFLTITPQEK